MIIQEIKLHPEPTIVTYQPIVNTNILPFEKKPTTGTHWSYLELSEQQQVAIKLGMNIGTKWRYPHSQTYIEIVGWQLAPAYINTVDGNPCIIRGKRKSPADLREDLVFNYSVEELCGMEQVND